MLPILVYQRPYCHTVFVFTFNLLFNKKNQFNFTYITYGKLVL